MPDSPSDLKQRIAASEEGLRYARKQAAVYRRLASSLADEHEAARYLELSHSCDVMAETQTGLLSILKARLPVGS